MQRSGRGTIWCSTAGHSCYWVPASVDVVCWPSVVGIRRVSSVRERTPSLWKIRDRFASTVFTEMSRTSATSRFFFPSPTSWAIRCSVGVSWLDGSTAPPTRARSSRALCPQRRTERLKETKRLLQGGAGGSLLLGSALHLALHQQGPGQLEGLRHPPVLHQSLLQRRTGPRQIAPGSGEQPSTSRGGGDGPWPIEGSSLPLQMTEECLGLIQPSQ